MRGRTHPGFVLGAVVTIGISLVSCNSAPTAPTVPSVDPPSTQGPVPPLPTTNWPRENLTGVYSLVLTAGLCREPFPEAGKRRVYAARVEQDGDKVRVFLSGADFSVGSGAFGGTIMSTGEIRFVIEPEWAWDYNQFDLVERLSGMTLIVQGGITARITASGISGTAEPGITDGNAMHIRVNNISSGWCPIDRFEMVPQSLSLALFHATAVDNP